MAVASPLDRALAQPRTRGEARWALLRRQGVTLADVARELGCHLSIVSRVNAGKKRSEPVERAIARHLGLQLAETFPEWYGGTREAAATRPRRVRSAAGSGR
jgi:lambda repressor-like predicted transcriptional regulator